MVPADSQSLFYNESAGTAEVIKIGLMVSADPATDAFSAELERAGLLAISELNRESTSMGFQFELVTKAGEGDWGSASRKSVSLIFDHEVVAIVGALDGENAHLTQMAVAKSHLVYIETMATDVTLSEVNIPFFFRMIPSDRQQAELIVSKLADEMKIRSILLIRGDRFDDRVASKEMIRAIQRRQLGISITELTYQEIQAGRELTLGSSSDGAPAIILIGEKEMVESIAETTINSNDNSLIFANSFYYSDKRYEKDRGLVTPDYFICHQDQRAIASQFFQNYQKEFDLYPHNQAAHVYDAITLVGEAVLRGYRERDEIRNYLAGLGRWEGASGRYFFDVMGDTSDSLLFCRGQSQ